MNNVIIHESKNFDDDNIAKLYNKATKLDFPWYLNRSTVLEDMYGNNFDEMFFTHMCFTEDKIYSSVMNDVSVIFENFCNAVGYDTNNIEVIRAQMNLSVRSDVNISVPHRDQFYDHKVFLCYLNDSDGDTIFYNETEESDEYSVLKTVSPEFGKAVIFNGANYHSVSFPKKNNHRIVINVDFV
jgi:hypothetical protein